MKSKKKRYRGSQTHGGGSRKNRRGAGHRGGRGNAGRSNHEQHNYEPLGKSGFNRPEKSKVDVHTVDLRDVDELLCEIKMGIKNTSELPGVKQVAADPLLNAYKELGCIGSYGSINNIHTVDITQFEDRKDADFSKLLGTGEIRNPVIVRTDECSRSARRSVKSKGGTVLYDVNRDRFKNKSAIQKAISKWYLKVEKSIDKGDVTDLEEYLEKTESGESLAFENFNETVEAGLTTGDPQLAYRIMESHTENISDVDSLEAINLMRARDFAREYELDSSPFEEMLESYFKTSDISNGFTQHMAEDLPSSMTVIDVVNGLDTINDFYDFDVYNKQPELRSERIRQDEVEYLMAVDETIDWI